ncbi:MAG: hypothetical protein AAF721_35130 [Myxococcota bacterium]
MSTQACARALGICLRRNEAARGAALGLGIAGLSLPACFVEPAADPASVVSTSAVETGVGEDGETGGDDDGNTSVASPATGDTDAGSEDDDGSTSGTGDADGETSSSGSGSYESDSSGSAGVIAEVLFDFYDRLCGPDVQRIADEDGNITVLTCGVGGEPLPYLDTQAAIDTPTGEVDRAIVMDFPALPIFASYVMVPLAPLTEANDPWFFAEFDCGAEETGFFQYTVSLRHADGSTSDPTNGVHTCGEETSTLAKPLPTDEDGGVAIEVTTVDDQMRRIVIADPIVVDLE